MEKKVDPILDAYSRFVVAIQNKLINGEFTMNRELFLQLLGGEV